MSLALDGAVALSARAELSLAELIIDEYVQSVIYVTAQAISKVICSYSTGFSSALDDTIFGDFSMGY